MKRRFHPMLKFFSNERTGKYFNGEKVFPIGVEFSPSGVCPANCRKCFYRVNNYELGGMDGKFFDFERFESLVYEMRRCGVNAITWTGGGEPTSHPRFPEMVELAEQAGLQQGLFTNALKPIRYDPSILQWIRVTKTNHPFPEKHILELRRCRTVGLCINYSVGDERFIQDGIRIAEELERLKASQEHSTYVQIRPEMNTLGALHECNLPKVEHPLVELTEKLSITEEGRGYTRCEGFHFVPFIWQNGKISVCAYHHGNPAFELGDLYRTDFRHIMLNAPQFVEVIPSCQSCCKLHQMNLAIEERRGLQDLNFI